jgi:hypothetical protein
MTTSKRERSRSSRRPKPTRRNGSRRTRSGPVRNASPSRGSLGLRSHGRTCGSTQGARSVGASHRALTKISQRSTNLGPKSPPPISAHRIVSSRVVVEQRRRRIRRPARLPRDHVGRCTDLDRLGPDPAVTVRTRSGGRRSTGLDRGEEPAATDPSDTVGLRRGPPGSGARFPQRSRPA